MIDFETSKKQIASLVEEFRTNEHIYKTAAFDEENTKINFINKFFQALGWDVTNEAGVAPQFKDVEFEDTVIVGGKPKAPDYCFRIGGARIFFVEAKKPSVDIEHDRRYAFQLKRYTWSAHLPLGLLTDFEELAIYEPKTAPKKTHNTSVDRIKYYHYSEYVEKWEEIYNLFSKQAVLTGKFDQYVKNIHGDKKGTSTVDSEFLKTIEEWRLELARNIALRNKELTVEELNFAVQLIIDRIIFLRIAEDRGIERYGQLKKLTELARNEKDNYPVYDAFIELCRKADAKYNSGLFHFTEEKDISLSADTLTPTLHVDDGKLKKIIDGLYYPDCPYEFSMISTEILGNIYEQFLGKVIRLTEAHQAKVEDKPEVKKAGGVFYTPQYIVNYIVENTVGELLKGKTPNKVSKLRIVDPACGSGSFLLGAYQKLLDWHVEYYSNLEQPPKNVIYTGKDGIPRLTIQEKKRILLNNIYGVDIDSQAVEVTKLSLLLKVLEDENKDVLEAQQKLIQERALPYLGDNIRCGNSLIGTDILEQQDLTMNELQSINPFDWKEEFSEIFKKGGFDAIIGNPPYIRMQIVDKQTNNYCRNNYITPTKGNYDAYIVFVEKAIEILNNEGIMGYILPHKFFTAKYGTPLRTFISENKNLNRIIHFGDQQVFENATTYTCLLFLNKHQNKKFYFDRISDLDKFKVKYADDNNKYLNFDKVDSNEWIFVSGDEEKVFYKLWDMPIKLTDNSNISQGLATSADKIYILPLIETYDLKSKCESKFLQEEICLENNILKPLLKGAEIKRYAQPKPNNVLIFPYSTDNDKLISFSRTDMKRYPLTFEYLNSTKDKLLKRSNVDTKNWWLYPYPKNLLIMEKPKIIYQVLSREGSFTLDEHGEYFYVGGGNAGGYAITTESNDINELKFLLGILNSKLTTFFISKVASCFRGGYYSFGKHSFEHFPLPSSNLNNKELINLVDEMIKLNKELLNCKVPNQEKILKIKISKTDDKINQLVFELYDLTRDEIRIIEESIGNGS